MNPSLTNVQLSVEIDLSPSEILMTLLQNFASLYCIRKQNPSNRICSFLAILDTRYIQCTSKIEKEY